MELNKYIDHTNLKPTATCEDIFKLCMEAKEYGFASVCVNSYWVRYCSELLTDIHNHINFICTIFDSLYCLHRLSFGAHRT